MNKDALEVIYNFLKDGEIEIEATTKGFDVMKNIFPKVKFSGIVTEYEMTKNGGIVRLLGDNFGYAFLKEYEHNYKLEKYENLLIIDINNQDFKIELSRKCPNIKPIEDLRIVRYYAKNNICDFRFGYFHKLTTRKDYDYCEEFAIIEDLNGRVDKFSLDDYSIKFISYPGGLTNE